MSGTLHEGRTRCLELGLEMEQCLLLCYGLSFSWFSDFLIRDPLFRAVKDRLLLGPAAGWGWPFDSYEVEGRS